MSLTSNHNSSVFNESWKVIQMRPSSTIWRKWCWNEYKISIFKKSRTKLVIESNKLNFKSDFKCFSTFSKRKDMTKREDYCQHSTNERWTSMRIKRSFPKTIKRIHFNNFWRTKTRVMWMNAIKNNWMIVDNDYQWKCSQKQVKKHGNWVLHKNLSVS